MLTREFVRSMNEADLRAKVLVPLLSAMGFQDVFEYHGGSGEQGKDIVCWRSDELGSRVNLAIVAKARAINGQAHPGQGTAGEAYMQVAQCFGKPFLDPRTGDECKVHICWVVSSQSIAKEAVDSIHSALASSYLDRLTRFIAGDKLWELIERHLPASAVLQKLVEVAEVLEGGDEHYQLEARIAGKRLEIGVAEKYPGAAIAKPFRINAAFAFPATPEGQQIRQALEHHIATGAPVDIPGPLIQSLEMPEFARKILGINNQQADRISIGPQ